MNETLRVLKQRRSIRSYRAEQISDDQLNEILEAGTFAPSGHGGQSAVMVVAQNPETVHEISDLIAAAKGKPGKDAFYGAPTVVVVLADTQSTTCVEDGSLVMGNLMNAAFSVGVDSCWINQARQAFQTPTGKSLLKKWGLSESYQGVGCCILGYRAETLPEPKARKGNYIVRI